jgi:hypothetical protein
MRELLNKFNISDDLQKQLECYKIVSIKLEYTDDMIFLNHIKYRDMEDDGPTPAYMHHKKDKEVVERCIDGRYHSKFLIQYEDIIIDGDDEEEYNAFVMENNNE